MTRESYFRRVHFYPTTSGIAGDDQRTRNAMQWVLSEVRQRL